MKLEFTIEKLESMNLPDPVYAAYKRYNAINKKSGMLASGLSMIIPGAEKSTTDSLDTLPTDTCSITWWSTTILDSGFASCERILTRSAIKDS